MDDKKRKEPTESLTWYVAYTNPRRESDCAEAIKRRSFETYVPAMTVTRRRSRVLRPLFPRYLFIGLQEDQALYGLRQAPGLAGMVRQSGRIVTVPGRLMSDLWREERSGGFNFTAEAEAARREARQLEEFSRAFKQGKTIEVTDGSFRFFKGKISAILPERRMEVLIQMFGRLTSLPLSFDQVRIVEG